MVAEVYIMPYKTSAATSAYMKAYYEKHSERIKARVKAHREGNREAYLVKQREYYAANRERLLGEMNRYREERKDSVTFIASRRKANQRHKNGLRDQVLAAYGDKCACCGETEPEFLTVEHVGGWGAKHRREGGWKARGGGLYRSIILAGFPKEFGVLCMQCNFATRGGKVCPHQKLDTQSVLRGMAC